MTVTFEVATTVAAPIDEVFDASRDIGAHVASQADTGEQAIAGVTTGLISSGETVTFQARHFGIRFTLTSRIVEFDRPIRFVDEQVSGPFHEIRHEHVFTETDGIVTMIDRVRFVAPLGPLGWLVERLVLGRYLHRLIVERGRHLKAQVERAAP